MIPSGHSGSQRLSSPFSNSGRRLICRWRWPGIHRIGIQGHSPNYQRKIRFLLVGQLSAYKKQDPPPNRVKPIPFPIIAHASNLCHLANTTFAHALADMLLLGFYFLLRPGEYAYTTNPDATPFRLQDVHLLIHN